MHDDAADRAALVRLADGDQHALDEIATRYHARLWRYLSRQLGGAPALVEEVLQDVYLALWQSAHRYRGDAAPATWIYGIAHFLVLDARKAQARHASHHVALPDDEADLALADASPEGQVIARMALAEAFAMLSPKHAEVLELVCNEGFSLGEVARILGIPEGTVKSRLSYARRALAAALHEGAHP